MRSRSIEEGSSSPRVEPGQVISAAYEIAVASATRGALDRRSLFDL
ncbi:hypothetical protein SAMN05421684_2893, partial [Asanoa ishikariensis]